MQKMLGQRENDPQLGSAHADAQQESAAESAGGRRILFQASIYGLVDKHLDKPLYTKEDIAGMEADYARQVASVAEKVRKTWESGKHDKEGVITLVRETLAELYRRVGLGDSDDFTGCFRQGKFAVVDCDSSAIFVSDVIRAVAGGGQKIRMALATPPSHALLKVWFSGDEGNPVYFETTTGRTEPKTAQEGFFTSEVFKPEPLIYYMGKEVEAEYPVMRVHSIEELNSQDFGQVAMALYPWVPTAGEEAAELCRQVLGRLAQAIEIAEKRENGVPDYEYYMNRTKIAKDFNGWLAKSAEIAESYEREIKAGNVAKEDLPGEARIAEGFKKELAREGKHPEASAEQISSDYRKAIDSISWEIGKFANAGVKFRLELSERYYYRAMANDAAGNASAALEDIGLAAKGIGAEVDGRKRNGINVEKMNIGGYADDAYALKQKIDKLKLELEQKK